MPIDIGGIIHYFTAEAAEEAGISRDTLLRYLRLKIIDDSTIGRDKRDRRLWTKEDIEHIRIIRKQQEQKKRMRGKKI